MTSVSTPSSPARARLKHLFRRRTVARAEVIEYSPLGMNLETYQAAIDGKPLDLTGGSTSC